MSHVICHECGSDDHMGGYGLAVGAMGTYTICADCSTVLEHKPDYEGMPEEVTVMIRTQHALWVKATNERRKEKGLPLLGENGLVDPHHGHGRGVDGPDDPDCPCRATELQADCAESGCGFCLAAEGEKR